MTRRRLAVGGLPPGWSCPVAEPVGVDVIRFLRPGRIARSARETWLVDESWPVAARLGDDEPMTLVAWPWPESRVDPEIDRVVVADGVGFVVAEGGQVAWVRRDSCTVAQVEGQMMLAAADPENAWFADRSVIDLGDPPEPPPPLPPGRIIAVRRDGSRTVVNTPAPVNAIGIRDADVWVTIAEAPLAHPGGHGSWSFEYPSSVLRVARDNLLADGLEGAQLANGDVPATGRSSSYSWTWLEDDPDTVLHYGVPAGGLVWWVGAPPAEDKINRRVVAVGHDPDTGRPLVRVDLGRGLVGDVQAMGNELWVTVARRRFLAVPADHGVEVLAVSASGAAHTVHSPASIDISQFAPPLRRPPDDEIDAHVEKVRQKFDHLESFWHGQDGATSALSEGLTDPSVSVEGEWPDARVVVTMRHRRRPGLVIRRTLPLFDEGGSPIEHEYADIDLMEDLDTNYLAPADEAVDGVLDT